jgi:RNA polymerase primary sigma factor
MRKIKSKSGIEDITFRTPTIMAYFNEVNKYPTLSAEEEWDLIQNNPNWRDQIVLHNLRFVLSVVKRYVTKTPDDFLNLIQVGNEGLITASRKFDPTRGFKFISFAVWHIQERILNFYSHEFRAIDMPLNLSGLQGRIMKLNTGEMDIDKMDPNDILELLYEQYPNTNYNLNQVKNVLRPNNMLSLNQPVNSDEGDTEFIDTLESLDKDYEDKESLENLLSQYLQARLDAKMYTILVHYMGLFGKKQMTFDELSLNLNLTRERVRQIYHAATRKLKKNVKLKEFLCEHCDL